MANASKEKALKTARGHVASWVNPEGDYHVGHCATLTTEKLGVWGCQTEGLALDKLADKLEALALEVRRMASKAKGR